jgi:hypothetical protein
LPVPLVTAGSPTDAFPGALGQPGTRILFGGQNIDYRSADGIRIAAGFWLPGEPFGGEISIFSLERKQTSFTAASDPTGNPALYFPVINAATGGEASLVISDPLLGFAGDVSVTSQTRLCGLEVNGLFAAATCDWGQVDLIAGFRTLDLEESIVIRNRTTDLVFGTFTDLNDRFETENQFYGCQVGFRATGYCSKFFATVGGKVAGGWTRSVVDIQGFTTQTSPTPGVPNGQFAGGFYTQPSNIGSREELKWSWVPEVNCRVGCDLFGCVRAFVGYDWLYWCNVARPGNQIDRTVSLAQSPALGFTAPGPTIARPAAFHTTSDFFVHGFSAGIELHY